MVSKCGGPEEQLNLPMVATVRLGPDLPMDLCGPRAASSTRDRVSIDLRGMGGRLRAEAANRQMTPASLIRRAVLNMLGEQCSSASSGVVGGDLGQHSLAEIKVTLRMPRAHAQMLAVRARDADTTQGRYVASLLDGMPQAPRSPGHPSAVAALRASTDGLAVLYSDLNAVLRALGRGQLAELDCCRHSMASLATDVRDHLVCASRLIAELAPTRRAAR